MPSDTPMLWAYRHRPGQSRRASGIPTATRFSPSSRTSLVVSARTASDSTHAAVGTIATVAPRLSQSVPQSGRQYCSYQYGSSSGARGKQADCGSSAVRWNST